MINWSTIYRKAESAPVLAARHQELLAFLGERATEVSRRLTDWPSGIREQRSFIWPPQADRKLVHSSNAPRDGIDTWAVPYYDPDLIRADIHVDFGHDRGANGGLEVTANPRSIENLLDDTQFGGQDIVRAIENAVQQF